MLVFLALAAWMSGSSWGATVATLYVDRSNASCSDTGPGTAAQPFCTIGAGAAVVTAGQTVQVASGTYPESVAVPRSGTASAPIVFTGAPGATVTLAGQANGFSVSGQSWVTVNGFAVTGTTSYGIYVSNSAHITISGNHVTYSGQPVSGKTKPGIRLSNVTDSLVDGNTADHNSYAGIELMSGSTRNVVSRNETFANARQYERAAPGIRLYGAPGNTVARNISHDNEDSGIEAYPGSNNTLIYDNVTYGNGDHGIDNLTSTGERIVANTVYDNVTAGINVEGGSTGAALANNISVDNGIKSPRTHSNIRIERGSTAGTTLDHDLVFLTTPDTMMIWDSTSYSSLAAFQAASGQEAHGIQADPRWVSPGSGDFHLRAGSPAIDSANSGASGQPGSDFEGNNHVDDPSTPNTGVGPRAYDDRGAYEFQPGGVSNSPPSAALAVTPSSGPAPLAVTADASGSADPDGNIASYAFDFGDGSAPVGPQMGATTTHTYPSTGAFTVTVTVTDSGGLSSTAVRQVTVSPPADAPPDPVLAVTPVSGVAPLDVIADGSGSTDADGTPIASYRFDFGDGTPVVGPQAGATAGHTYASAGAFTVTMTVTDTGGLSSSATRQVTVSATNTAPTAALSVSPTSGSAPLVVAADASGSTDPEGNITSYRFDFGDGTPVVGPQPGATATHTYTSPGTYTVTMTVADTGGLSSTATAQVNATVTNLVGNPGFETDLSGWNTSGSGSGIALTRVDGGHSGSWAAKLTNTGATNATCTLNDSPDWARPTQAGTYTGTIWVRGDTAGATLKLRFREWSGSTLAGSQTTTVTLASSWQQVAVAYTVQSPGSSLDFNAYLASADAPPGTCFYADDIAITVS